MELMTAHGSRKSALDSRLDAVIAARRPEGTITSDKAWEAEAGRQPGYLKQQRFRACRDSTWRLPEDGAEALALAARVDVRWLRFGDGAMEPTVPYVVSPRPPSTAAVGEPNETEVALVNAFLQMRERDAADLLHALEFVRRTTPDGPPISVEESLRLLHALRRLRLDGTPLTPGTLTRELLKAS